ncbi:MAG: hypothetical protein R6U96_10820 [Promethearchaeia archaeon]
MTNKKLRLITESKIFLFLIQMGLLYTLKFVFQYEYKIAFDETISSFHRDLIKFLGGFFLFGPAGSLPLLPYVSWTLAALVPILIHRKPKKAYSLNLLTFFLINFFFYVFLERYSSNFYYAHNFSLFLQSIILGIYLFGISISLGFVFQKLGENSQEENRMNLEKIVERTRSECPYCGTKFESIPEYCYKCSKKIPVSEKSEIRETK